jgi:Domain of unknown function (DUF4124)
MRKSLLAIGLLTFAVSTGAGGREGTVYRWVDEDGIVHYDDSVPPEYAEQNKDILTDDGVKVGSIRGRKTAEELAAEREAAELQAQKDLQLRADKALLATYLTVDEIRLHRDRRVELFQAQSRVTELFLSNLENRLKKLEREASRYQPYSGNPDAAMIDPELVSEISETKTIIGRHEANLRKFVSDEQSIVARFEGDINRFKALKGIN